MAIPSLFQRSREIDLDDEQPTTRSEVRIGTQPHDHVSRLGRSVLFFGDVQPRSIDVDKLAAVLRQAGAAPEYTDTLAVAVHPQNGSHLPGIKDLVPTGWHKFRQALELTSPDGETVRFDHVLHVVDGADMEDTLFHEAGHLSAHSTGTERASYYSPQNVQRLRHLGALGLATGGLIDAAAATAMAFGGRSSLAEAGAAMVVGSAVFLGSWLARNMPGRILWMVSPDEHAAEAFAGQYQEQRLVYPEEPLPSNHFVVDDDVTVRYVLPMHAWMNESTE